MPEKQLVGENGIFWAMDVCLLLEDVHRRKNQNWPSLGCEDSSRSVRRMEVN